MQINLNIYINKKKKLSLQRLIEFTLNEQINELKCCWERDEKGEITPY